MSIVPDLVTGLFQTKVERFCQLAAGVVVGYEYVITFQEEVHLFWIRRWSLGKFIFLWSRYFGLAFNIGNAIVFMQEHPSLDLCLHFFRWQNTGSILSILTTHFILEFRLYAMYGSSKKLLAFFVLLTLAEIGVTIYLFETPVTEAIGTNEPIPGVSICADADAPHHHFYAYFPTSSLITEAILLSLALWKSITMFSSGAGTIADLLTRDSVRYFIVIFSIYLGVAILWFYNDITMNESLTGFMFALSIICANRLLINIRSLYYSCEETSEAYPSLGFNSKTMPQWKRKGSSTLSTNLDSIELTTVSQNEASTTNVGTSTWSMRQNHYDSRERATFSERQGF